ncbi:MAG: hypothetical protein OEZ13_08135 [Spirochaetia bacterium]|nr:hypothetical protein [Spirochaetia bacterium]
MIKNKIMKIIYAVSFLCIFSGHVMAQGTVQDMLEGESEQPSEQSAPEPQAAPESESGETADSSDDSTSAAASSSGTGDEMQYSIVAGATTVDGMNYQQIGIRGDFPIFSKLGFGLDLQILLDEEGNIRKEDWDEGVDYLDKIYYIRWGKKGDPLYLRAGGLDYTYLGYGSTVWGYSNMVEYPTYKRVGFEMGYNNESFGMEYFMNNFKELKNANPSVITGGRLVYKPIDRISVGASLVGDINQYNGLRDNDGDDYPDAIDYDPYDGNIAVEKDIYSNALDSATADIVIPALVNAGLISGTNKEDLFTMSGNKSRVAIYGGDIGFEVIKGKDEQGKKNFMQLDVYAQWAMIHQTKGWGFAAPGVMLRVGPIKLMADYRQRTDKFIFRYFNNTYELERAGFVEDESGNPVASTKLDQVRQETAKRGIFASLGFDIFGLGEIKADYEILMKSGEPNDQSLTGELKIKDGLIPKISEVKAYYVQNNIANLKHWKSESTIWGYKAGIKISEGVAVVFDTRYTYEDKNADGKIAGEDETVKTFSITTTSVF